MKFFSLKGFLIFAVLIPLGCFEYQESLVFSPDFSGYVDIQYDVPVYEEEDRSMIAFLPVDINKIKEKYDRFLTEEQYSLEEYNYKRSKTDAGESRGVVSYRVRFTNPRNLEFILIGKNKISRQGGRLYFQRTFLATSSPADDASKLSNNLYSKVFQSFNNKKMTFRIIFPWYYDLVTNVGTFTRPGVHNFVLPLENTFNTDKPVIWNFELKANPVPEAGF